jgi:Leucine-rich repeat (LRR) protein
MMCLKIVLPSCPTSTDEFLLFSSRLKPNANVNANLTNIQQSKKLYVPNFQKVYATTMDEISKSATSTRRGGPDDANDEINPPIVRKRKKSKSYKKKSSVKQIIQQEDREVDSILQDSSKPSGNILDVRQEDSSDAIPITPNESLRKEKYSSIQPGAVSVRGEFRRHRSVERDDDLTMDHATILRDHESGLISDLTPNTAPIVATIVNESVSQASTLNTVPPITCCTLIRDYRVLFIILVIMLIASGLIVASVMIFLSPNTKVETVPPVTESPTLSPTEWNSEQFIKSLLEPTIAWEQAWSPQSQALKYLENVTLEDESWIPQAYAAQVLRYGILKENGIDISTLETEGERNLKSKYSDLFNECSWLIMTCSNQGRITSIRMNYGYYSFTLPEELALLTDLNEINLSGNKGYGTLPSIFASFMQVKEFILDDNQFTGTIPTQIASMDKLVTFSFSNNRFDGTIPSEFGLTTTLHEFDADGNDMTGTLPSEIFANPEFCYLYLSGNRLRGSLPTELGSYSILKNVHLDGNSFTGTIPTEIGNLIDLGELKLHDNELNGNIPSEIGKLSISLTVLRLENNKLIGTIPVQLTQLTELWDFMLAKNELTGTLHTELGRLRKLANLDLGENKFNGTIPTQLGFLVNIGRYNRMFQ